MREDDFRNATDRLLVEATRRDGDTVMREVLDRILSALNSLTFVKPDAAEILFADPQDGQSLVVAYSTNVDDIGVRVDIGTSVCGQAFHDGRTVLLQRAIESPAYRPIMVLAADQVLNAVHRINNHVGSIRAIVADLLEDLDSPSPPDHDDLTSRLGMSCPTRSTHWRSPTSSTGGSARCRRVPM
jgi:hypothetical protein